MATKITVFLTGSIYINGQATSVVHTDVSVAVKPVIRSILVEGLHVVIENKNIYISPYMIESVEWANSSN